MENTLAGMITSIGTLVTAIFTWVASVCQAITTTPLLFFTVGFLAVGGAVGIVGRLLSRN